MVSKKEWIKRLTPYWKEYQKAETEFFKKVNEIETRMRTEQKEPNLEFAYPKMAGGIELYFGIGFQLDGKNRSPNLIHDDELET